MSKSKNNADTHRQPLYVRVTAVSIAALMLLMVVLSLVVR